MVNNIVNGGGAGGAGGAGGSGGNGGSAPSGWSAIIASSAPAAEPVAIPQTKCGILVPKDPMSKDATCPNVLKAFTAVSKQIKAPRVPTHEVACMVAMMTM